MKGLDSHINVIHYKEIDSTNNEAKKLINGQKDLPCWIIADKQTSGRGRKDRFWDSPIGNFMGTYVLTIKGEKRILPQLSFVSALAIHNTIMDFRPEDSSEIMLKWPNDIIINNKKCGGILIENIFSKDNSNHIIAIGIGINLKSSPLHSTFPSGNILQEFNISIERDEFLASMNKNILKFLSLWDRGSNYKYILNTWKSKAYLLNRKITVSLPNGNKKEGIFSTIDEEGGLILLNNNGIKEIFYAAEIFEGL
tara:strand:- start:69 stop:827 length:759 start_codon:yes stop_codon:yes gene_type:complete